MIKDYRIRMHDYKNIVLESRKTIKTSQNYKNKRYAAIILIQRAYKSWKSYSKINHLTLPSLEMIAKSQFLEKKWKTEALVKGWKTRKILSAESIKNHRIQISEVKSFYALEGDSNKYLIQAKNNYIQVVNSTLDNAKWWQDLVKSKILKEKRERVKKMREKKQRVRNNIAFLSNKSHTNHNTSSYTDYRSNTSMDSGNNRGFKMAFDFSRTCKRRK